MCMHNVHGGTKGVAVTASCDHVWVLGNEPGSQEQQQAALTAELSLKLHSEAGR